MSTDIPLTGNLTDPPEPRYQFKSITIAPTPEGSDGTWYRYVIAQGSNEIAGLRRGDQSEVNIAVREMVDRLNERSAGKSAKKAKTASPKSPPFDVSTV